MLNLTQNIAVPNITRMRLRAPQMDDAANVLRAQVEVGGAGGRIYALLQLEVRNGSCNGVRATAAPVTFADMVEGFTLAAPLPTGFDDAVAAFVGATLAARLRGLETWAISVGLLPAGTVS